MKMNGKLARENEKGKKWTIIIQSINNKKTNSDLSCIFIGESASSPRRYVLKEGIPINIKTIHEKMISIPRWIICAPEYNGSIPPLLTNTIAWLSVQESDFRKLFNGRPIAIASFSGGGCMELLLSMRIQLTHLGSQVVGRQLASNSKSPAKDESIQDLIERLMQMEPLKLDK